jgi:hypothetical protein
MNHPGRLSWIVVVFLLGLGLGRAEAQDSGAAMQRGAKYVRARNYPKALEAFLEAIKADPAQLDAYYNAGTIAQKLGRCRDVLLYYRGFLYMSPGTADDKTARDDIAKCEAKPGIGGLSVKSEPPAIEAYLDGVVVGRTPITEVKLLPGTYRLELKHPDYIETSEEVVIATGETRETSRTLEHKLLYGELEIRTVPAEGVQVYLDDKPAGTTPVQKMRLETRKYLIRLEKSGFETWIRNVVIGRDRTLTVNATLEVTVPPEIPGGPDAGTKK